MREDSFIPDSVVLHRLELVTVEAGCDSGEIWRMRLGHVLWRMEQVCAIPYPEAGIFITICIMLPVFMHAWRYRNLLWVLIVLVAAYILNYIATLVLTNNFLLRTHLVQSVLDGQASLGQALAAFGAAEAPLDDKSIDGLGSQVNQLCQGAQLAIVIDPAVRSWRRSWLVFHWIVFTSLAVYGLLQLAGFWQIGNGFVSTALFRMFRPLDWLFIAFALFILSNSVTIQELVKARLLGALKSELGDELLHETVESTPGTLKQRLDLVHHNQHIMFFVVFWLYGLFPAGVVVFIWSIGLLENPWPLLPVLSTIVLALALAARELFSWRADLRRELRSTSLALELAELELHQPPGVKPRQSDSGLFELLQSDHQDPAALAAQRLATRLPLHLPPESRRAAKHRLLSIAGLYVVITLLICAAGWARVGALPEGVWVYIVAGGIGAIHLALLLHVVRTYLPFIEVLDYFDTNL